MGLYSYSFQNRKRDLSDILSTVIKDEPRFISNFKTVEPATSRKHEWFEDQMAGRSLTATAYSAGTVTASEADVAKLKVGTLLVIRNDSALFRVTAIPTVTTFTINLEAANGSSTTAPASNSILNIVSTPMAEASANGDGEENYHLSGTNWNATQIFRKDIVLSGSSLAIGVYGNLDNQLNRQTAFALSELARDLNRVARFVRRVEATSSVRGECGGLYFFATGENALKVDGNAKQVDSFMINDAAQLILAEGGDPIQILCSPGQARVLSNEYRHQLQIVRSDDRRGASVAVIVNEINGHGMTIMADPDMPDGDVFVCDPSGFGLAPLTGRSIPDEDSTPRGFDGIQRMALGELTFEFKNPLARICRITNIKSSAAALASLRGTEASE